MFLVGTGPPALVEERMVEFQWFPGFSAEQKRRSIAALHEGAGRLGLPRVLEVSTKSTAELGRRASAFSLKTVTADGTELPLESAFQGSKVFAGGGPFVDLYRVAPRDAKRDPRLRASGPLVAFHFEERRWPLEPTTAFYDWMYIRAVLRDVAVAEGLLEYEAFSDIEFNPAKSVNCQARSAALYVALSRKGVLRECADDADRFVQVAYGRTAPGTPTQLDLFM